jgi:large subunit ribosomal protein L7Ae
MSYVNKKVPSEMQKEALGLIPKFIKAGGKLITGLHDATKAVERKKAKLLLIASNINPPEILFYLPPLCDEKGIPYLFIDGKKELGEACELKIGLAAVAFVENRKSKDFLTGFIERVKKL